jgi:hypothetical protein
VGVGAARESISPVRARYGHQSPPWRWLPFQAKYPVGAPAATTYWKGLSLPHHVNPMNTLRIITILALALAVALISACGESRTWPADGNPEGAPNNVRTVLIAPVEVGPIANVYPEAELQFARDMASRMDLLYENSESWVGETLPVSSDPRWAEGPVGAAAGARVVVLTEVLDVVLEKGGAGMPEQMAATVRMRGMDANGKEIYRNELVGRADNESSPKMMQIAAKPAPKAVWVACKKLIDGLGEWIEKQPIDAKQWGDDRPEAVLVDVTIESTPTGADILVDGVFRGTTPSVVPLPVRPLTLKLERQGFQPWEQSFTPDSGMAIKPGLEPLAGAAPAQAAPAPATPPK